MMITVTIRTCLFIASALCFGMNALRPSAKVNLDAGGKCLFVAAMCFG